VAFFVSGFGPEFGQKVKSTFFSCQIEAGQYSFVVILLQPFCGIFGLFWFLVLASNLTTFG